MTDTARAAQLRQFLHHTPWSERPMAVAPYRSYRYRGRFGWMMIGAMDDAEALTEVKRGTSDPIDSTNLQYWDGERYHPVAERKGEQP